tara:strand:+ start:182 stop:316 length:135 start_codon:yes stop_codon:yes gene_type:complete
MTNEELQKYLESLVAEGLARGLTQKQAEDFANQIYFSKLNAADD